MSTFPADSSFLIDLPFGKTSQPAVLYVPRTGDAAFYTQAMGMIVPLPAANVKWEGDSFQFNTLVQTLGNGRESQPLPSYDYAGVHKP